MLRELIQRFPGHFIGLLILIFIQGGLNAVSIISIAPITDLLLKQSGSEVNEITSIFQSLVETLGFDFNIVITGLYNMRICKQISF